jgi:hypothetical protein
MIRPDLVLLDLSALTDVAGGLFVRAPPLDALDLGALENARDLPAAITGPLPQTISFPALADRTLAETPLTLAATASSGLPVSFAVVSGPATLSGNALTLTGPGTVTVAASQAGGLTGRRVSAEITRHVTVPSASTH